MQTSDLIALTGILLALQFAAFGWRIVREIEVADQGRRIWLPVPDLLNIISMIAVVVFGLVLPLAHHTIERPSRVVLAAGFIMIAFHPLSMAGHYCLFSKYGRNTYKTTKGDWRYCQPPEVASVGISLAAAMLVGWYVAVS